MAPIVVPLWPPTLWSWKEAVDKRFDHNLTLDSDLSSPISTMPGPASTSSNTRPSSTMPSQRPAVNTQTKVLDTTQGRILCIADIRGNISHLNTLASEANAQAIIHTGDFGFIDADSLDRISDRSVYSFQLVPP
ncbi:hypothetical protein CPB86DRAFT_69156 [Serendipita vermifera]|nr:hypothetical protein CPB86DRAFT_69156 [Serendipita vermifera]